MWDGQSCIKRLESLIAVALMVILVTNIVTILANSNSATALDDSSNPVVSWNKLATKLATQSNLPPTKLARAYSLLHVAMYDSILDARNTNSTTPISASSLIVGSASKVLSFLFPNGTADINKLKNLQLLAAKESNNNNTYSKGLLLGDQVGQNIIKYAKNDGSDLPFTGHIPAGKCIWNGTNPVTPMAGYWKTYILKSGAEIQPPAPAICGSNEDKLNVQDILQASHSRTPQQIAAVHRWGDTLPPVIWNNILNQLINTNHLNIFDSARISAYMNIAMYDAFVSTWYTKYTYWTARPFQRIANFTTVIPTPNFPGYTSGHSTISAAAIKVLSDVFPDEQNYFNSLLTEASMSRFWAGIHFKEDIDNGMRVGLAIGGKIVDDMHSIPHPLVNSN